MNNVCYPVRNVQLPNSNNIIEESWEIDSIPHIIKSPLKKIVYNHIFEFFHHNDICGWEDIHKGYYVIWFYAIVVRTTFFKNIQTKKIKFKKIKFGISIVQDIDNFRKKTNNFKIIEDNHIIDNLYMKNIHNNKKKTKILNLLKRNMVVQIIWNKKKMNLINLLSLNK